MGLEPVHQVYLEEGVAEGFRQRDNMIRLGHGRQEKVIVYFLFSCMFRGRWCLDKDGAGDVSSAGTGDLG